MGKQSYLIDANLPFGGMKQSGTGRDFAPTGWTVGVKLSRCVYGINLFAHK